MFFIDNPKNRKNFQIFFMTFNIFPDEDYMNSGYLYNPEWADSIPEGYTITKIIRKDNGALYVLATDGKDCIQVPSHLQTWNLGEGIHEPQSFGRTTDIYRNSKIIYNCDEKSLE